jgi:hypothetical protein
LFQGLSVAGENIAKAIEEAKKAQDEQAGNQIIIDHALANGRITPEEHTKYLQGSAGQKNSIVAGLARNFAMDIEQQKLNAAKEAQTALSEERSQRAAALNWTPDAAAQQSARWTGNELVPVGPGKYALAPYGGGSGQDQVVTDPLTISGKAIPGIGVNRKTGQYVYYGGMQGGGVQVQTDPKTNLPYYIDQKGQPHFLTTNQVMAGNMMPSNAPAPSATPGFIARQLQSLFGGGASPTPAPAAAQAPVGVAPGYGAQLSEQDQQALAWARAHPKDSRATAILGKLGITQ